MKKITLLLSIVVCSSFFACKSGDNNGAARIEGTNLVLNVAEWSDSARLTVNNMAEGSILTLYVTGDKSALADSINLWICKRLGIAAREYGNIPAAVKEQGAAMLASDSTELAEILSSVESAANYAFDMQTSLEYQDSAYITIKSLVYRYMAGAHGSTFVNYSTFRKRDGKCMGWELLKEKPDSVVRSAIKDGLKGYFKVNSEEELYGCLFIDKPSETNADAQGQEILFPLPSTPPFLTKDGIRVIYQQYEIAPYAAGMPSCVIE